MKTALIAVCLSLAVPVLVPTTGPTQDQGVYVEGDSVVLPSGEQGHRLDELLAVGSEILGIPIAYIPQSVGDTHIFFAGELRCPLGEFRTLLDDLLLRFAFVTWDSDAGSPVCYVRRIGMGSTMGGSASVPGQVITLGEAPARNSATYTTTFPLQHIDARSAMASFNPFVDTRWEGIRNVENSNALVVTALSVRKLEQIAELIAQVDVPSRFGEVRDRMGELEHELIALRDRVEAVEEPSGVK
jgi:hypothetical protein